MKRYVLQSPDGKWAAYNIGHGPWITDNRNWRYEWDTEAEAQAQRPLYESALLVKLSVEEVQS